MRAKPQEAAKEILAAYKKGGANAVSAAALLGCSYRTFWNWVEQLQLQDAIANLEEKAREEGWLRRERRGGRPEGTGGTKLSEAYKDFAKLAKKRPDLAAKVITRAFRDGGRRHRAAAEKIGCTMPTYRRWVRELGIQAELDLLAQQQEHG